ncbi:hypothetical protein EMCRGX_G009882 [Ephydatia muelleri]
MQHQSAEAEVVIQTGRSRASDPQVLICSLCGSIIHLAELPRKSPGTSVDVEVSRPQRAEKYGSAWQQAQLNLVTRSGRSFPPLLSCQLPPVPVMHRIHTYLTRDPNKLVSPRAASLSKGLQGGGEAGSTEK